MCGGVRAVGLDGDGAGEGRGDERGRGERPILRRRKLWAEGQAPFEIDDGASCPFMRPPIPHNRRPSRNTLSLNSITQKGAVEPATVTILHSYNLMQHDTF